MPPSTVIRFISFSMLDCPLSNVVSILNIWAQLSYTHSYQNTADREREKKWSKNHFVLLQLLPIEESHPCWMTFKACVKMTIFSSFYSTKANITNEKKNYNSSDIFEWKKKEAQTQCFRITLTETSIISEGNFRHTANVTEMKMLSTCFMCFAKEMDSAGIVNVSISG